MKESYGGMPGIQIAAHPDPTEAVRRAEAGQQARTDQFARLLASKRRWQKMATGLLVIAGLTTGWAIWTSTGGRQVEVFVERIDAFGLQQSLDRAPAHPQKPASTVVKGVIRRWIEHARDISSDPRVFGKAWDEIADYSTQTLMKQLQDFREYQAERQRRGARVQTEIGPIMPVGGSGKSFTVEWREEAYMQSGVLVQEESGIWRATITLADFAGKAAQQEMDLRRRARNFRNIDGVFLHDVNWSQVRPLPEGESAWNR